MHHLKADADQIYGPRWDGGRGMIQMEIHFKITIGLNKHLSTTNDWILQWVLQHDATKKTHLTIQAKEIKRKAKNKRIKYLIQNCENEPLHDWYLQWSQQADVYQSNTHQWLCSVSLKAETEGFIMVAQDQSFFIRWYKARIIKKGTDHYVAKCVTNKMRH